MLLPTSLGVLVQCAIYSLNCSFHSSIRSGEGLFLFVLLCFVCFVCLFVCFALVCLLVCLFACLFVMICLFVCLPVLVWFVCLFALLWFFVCLFSCFAFVYSFSPVGTVLKVGERARAPLTQTPPAFPTPPPPPPPPRAAIVVICPLLAMVRKDDVGEIILEE